VLRLQTPIRRRGLLGDLDGGREALRRNQSPVTVEGVRAFAIFRSKIDTYVLEITFLIVIVIEILKVIIIILECLVIEGLSGEIIHCAGYDLL
jgi:hypothetical protein